MPLSKRKLGETDGNASSAPKPKRTFNGRKTSKENAASEDIAPDNTAPKDNLASNTAPAAEANPFDGWKIFEGAMVGGR